MTIMCQLIFKHSLIEISNQELAENFPKIMNQLRLWE